MATPTNMLNSTNARAGGLSTLGVLQCRSIVQNGTSNAYATTAATAEAEE